MATQRQLAQGWVKIRIETAGTFRLSGACLARRRPLHTMVKFTLAALAALAALACAEPVDFEAHLIRTTWGVPAFDEPGGWKAWMQSLAAAGYAGVEAPTWLVCGVPDFSAFGCEHECDAARAATFRAALDESGLYYIAQVHTCGYPIASGEVGDHVTSLEALARLAAGTLGAALANVHGGCDWWGDAPRAEFFARAAAVEAAVGLPLSHETHRMRALATPWAAASVLLPGGAAAGALAAPPAVTADLSHWVVVGERAMGSFPADAAWWPALLAAVANASVLTHARVGSPREIQVGDPAAAEVRELLETYETWWDAIWAAQARAGKVVRLEAEFGPQPYMPSLPHTNVPVADLDAAVEYIGRRQMRRLHDGECGVQPVRAGSAAPDL